VTVFLFSTPRQLQEWQPAVDIYRTKFGWVLKFDLAGVRMEDIDVHISRKTVMVSGQRRDSMHDEGGCRHYSMEISYSRFQREIELPEDIHAARMAVDYRDGILTVRIAQREESENENE
jgi:HSP20 family protein